MRPRRKFRLLSEINITPLTDVMLVLLIIFMATSSFILAGQALNLNLPSAQGDQLKNPETTLSLELNCEGKIFLQGKEFSLKELKNQLLTFKKPAQTPPPVLLRVDRSCSYESFIKLLELLSNQGFSRLSLAVKPGEEGKSE